MSTNHITADDVDHIIGSCMDPQSLAAQYGLSKTAINEIQHGGVTAQAVANKTAADIENVISDARKARFAARDKQRADNQARLRAAMQK